MISCVDTDCIAVYDSEHAFGATSVFNRQDRQYPTRPNAASEVRLLSPSHRGQFGRSGEGVEGTKVWGILPLFVSDILLSISKKYLDV